MVAVAVVMAVVIMKVMIDCSYRGDSDVGGSDDCSGDCDGDGDGNGSVGECSDDSNDDSDGDSDGEERDG